MTTLHASASGARTGRPPLVRAFDLCVHRPIDDVFRVVSDLRAYDAWLPASDVFVHVRTDPGPIRAGTRYVDVQRFGLEMPGEVEIFEPPRRVVFRQHARLPLGARVEVRVAYALSPAGAETRVRRVHEVALPRALRPLSRVVERKLAAENLRILERLRARCEAADPEEVAT